VGSDTALAQMVKLVQEAQSSKAPGQQLADRAAFWLVLVALIGGTLTLIVWLLAGRTFSQAILFAITVVVITCPDALGLATPTAIMVGTGLGARRGILIKNGEALEKGTRIDVIVFDKTGTLTEGKPKVTDIHSANRGVTEDRVLALAASIEALSEHPLASAIVRAASEKNLPLEEVADFSAIAGKGVRGKIRTAALVAGNERVMRESNVPLGEHAGRMEQLEATAKTVIGIAFDS